MAMDRALHAARVTRSRRQVRHEAELADLPDGSFALIEGRAHLVLGDALLPFEPGGYGRPRKRNSAVVTVLSPAPAISVLAAGYTPVVHDSALAR